MQQFKFIKYGTPQYQMTLELRNKVMRKPLGRNIFDEDLSCEKDSIILGVFDDEKLLAVGVLSHKDNLYKVEYLCVDTDLQHSGLGSKIITQLADLAKSEGGTEICLDARLSAQHFYEKLGYKPVGEPFIIEYAPVGHIVMKKSL